MYLNQKCALHLTTNKWTGIKPVPTLLRFFPKTLMLLCGLLLSVTTITTAHAALTATTANVIQGTAPYLTFDGGTTKAKDTSGLLSITLSDGTRYVPAGVIGIYPTATANTSSATSPIELLVGGETLEDVDMFIPVGLANINLNTLIGAPYNYWGDDDGDDNPTATGSLTLTIKDSDLLLV